MQVKGLNLAKIPPTSVLRSDADVRTFLAANREALLAGGRQWVHETSRAALKVALEAGNPTTYYVTIDGVTSRVGNVRRGFKRGTIEESQHAVRIEFNADTLANVARAVTPILTNVIRKTFPRSKTGRLSREWSWWLKLPGKSSVWIGKTIPDDLPVEAVLFLAPDNYTAGYAYVANHYAASGGRPRFVQVVDKKQSRLQGRQVFKMRRNSVRGYLARATAQLRGKRAPGVNFKGGFTLRYLTGRYARPGRHSNRGVPFIRVSFKGLNRPVSV